jgi:phosphoglycerate dehydrogenase-like enzyme
LKNNILKHIPDSSVSIHNDSRSFKANLAKTDIALVWVFKQSWLKLAPNLKWIATPSAGKDWFKIDLPKKIKITYGGFHGEIIAETIIAAMLCFSRGLFFIFKNQTEKLWPRREIESQLKTLRGSHLVILGFGKIGQWIAKLAKHFGVRITGVKRTLIEKPEFFDKRDKIITIEELDSILPSADHLVLSLPRDKSTDNILNKKRLELLPKDCYVYNIGRGNAIDEIALADCLKKDRIKGAYLDVFKTEPLDKDSPLRDCDNILITPHSSAIAPNFLELFIEEFIENYYQLKNDF